MLQWSTLSTLDQPGLFKMRTHPALLSVLFHVRQNDVSSACSCWNFLSRAPWKYLTFFAYRARVCVFFGGGAKGAEPRITVDGWPAPNSREEEIISVLSRRRQTDGGADRRSSRRAHANRPSLKTLWNVRGDFYDLVSDLIILMQVHSDFPVPRHHCHHFLLSFRVFFLYYWFLWVASSDCAPSPMGCLWFVRFSSHSFLSVHPYLISFRMCHSTSLLILLSLIVSFSVAKPVFGPIGVAEKHKIAKMLESEQWVKLLLKTGLYRAITCPPRSLYGLLGK